MASYGKVNMDNLIDCAPEMITHYITDELEKHRIVDLNFSNNEDFRDYIKKDKNGNSLEEEINLQLKIRGFKIERSYYGKNKVIYIQK